MPILVQFFPPGNRRAGKRCSWHTLLKIWICPKKLPEKKGAN